MFVPVFPMLNLILILSEDGSAHADAMGTTNSSVYIMKNTLKTFDEWSAEGGRIYKGSKAVGRNANGVAVFSSSQVWFPENVAEREDLGDDGDYDEWGFNPFEIYDFGDQ